MKKHFLPILSAFLGILSVVSLLTPMAAEARSYRTRSSDVRVGGYTRSNGTYVQPYYRSKADSYRFNNYSYLDYGRYR